MEFYSIFYKNKQIKTNFFHIESKATKDRQFRLVKDILYSIYILERIDVCKCAGAIKCAYCMHDSYELSNHFVLAIG